MGDAIAILLLAFLLFMALRWVMLWYWKINQIVDLLTKIEAKLQPQYVATAVPTKDTSKRNFTSGNHKPLSHDEIMAKYGIVNDGESYIYQGRRFSDVRDAATFAEANH